MTDRIEVPCREGSREPALWTETSRARLKQCDVGTIGNTIAGIVGGVAAQIIGALVGGGAESGAAARPRYRLHHRPDGIRWERRYPDGDRRTDQTDDGRSETRLRCVACDDVLADHFFLLLVLSPRLGCARPRLGSVQQRRIQPARQRIDVQLLGSEPAGAGQQQRRLQSAIVFRHRLYHRLARRPGRFPQLIVTGAARLSSGTAARTAICPPTALLMPVATIGQAKRHAGHRSGEGRSQQRRVARGPALPGSGPLTAVALWAALNSLSSPGSASYFHNYQYDPGYVQWRREADREAGQNPAVAAKLDQLDAQLAQMEGQPRNPSATAPVRPSPAPAGGSGFIWPVLFIGIVILLLLWLWRRRLAQPAVAAAAPGLAGSAATRFRVGMTMPVDPSPVCAGCRIDQGAAA